MNDRLYRSRTDRMLAGVAGGVADRFELDPSLVRVLWAVLVVLSGGIFLLIYIVMAIVVPEEPLAVGSHGGWTATGSSGWSSSWPSSSATGAPSGPVPGPAPGAPPDPAAGTSSSAGSGPAGSGPAGPGFAAPIAGGWSPPGPAATDAAMPPSSWSGESARDARHAARDARRAARQARRGSGHDGTGSGGIIAGLFLVTIGIFFLVRTFVPALDIDRYWPAGLIALGVVLVALSIRRTPGGSAP